MRDILVLGPQERDVTGISAARLEERYRIHFEGSDLDQLVDFDPEAFLDEAAGIPAAGVIGTKDQSALLAALLARRRGLPGPSPESLIALQHKPTSRELQRRAAPEATPRFAPVDSRVPFKAPFFVKPVVGRLSQNVYRIDDLADLVGLQEIDSYTTRYAQIAQLAGADPSSVHGFLAEELLVGDEVTLEGYVSGGKVTTIGVTDSVKYPETFSFERFEYPSKLSEERQAELADVASRVLPALRFDGGFFNVEFFVPECGPAQIIEVNGRIASQFAPLVQSLHGRSTYDALFELACGDDPAWQTGIPDGVAVSYVMRVFEDAFVEEVPDPEGEMELLVRPGLFLSEQGVNDAQSYRLAILYCSGETREEAVERARERAASLNFRLAPAPVR
jgi:ATP-grasp domain-containing protein